MDGPSHEFLAGADLALDEDREQGVARLPDLLDKLFQLLIRGHQPPQRAPDDLVCFLEVARALLDGSLQLVGPALQRQLLLLHLTTQLVHLNRAAQRRHEVLPLDRLLDKVAGPAAQGLHRQGTLAMPGDHQGGRVGPARPDLRQEREPVHPRHLDVGDDRIVVLGGDPLKRGRGRVGRVHGHPAHAEAQGLGERLQQGRVVVDDEDVRRRHAARGRWIKKAAPSPGGLTTEIVPPCSLMIP